MPTKEEEARYLANSHYEIESGMSQVFRVIAPGNVERDPGEPIKLLEVNENTFPSGILPIGFGPLPSSGIHYSSIIVEVTPDEFAKIRSQEWELPHGWKVGELIPRAEAVVTL
jgi:hypothetical protein